jgi:hypothetical protein
LVERKEREQIVEEEREERGSNFWRHHLIGSAMMAEWDEGKD